MCGSIGKNRHQDGLAPLTATLRNQLAMRTASGKRRSGHDLSRTVEIMEQL